MELYSASKLVIGKVRFEENLFGRDSNETEELIFEKSVLNNRVKYKSISNGTIIFVNLNSKNLIDVVEVSEFSLMFPDIKVISKEEVEEFEYMLRRSSDSKVLVR